MALLDYFCIADNPPGVEKGLLLRLTEWLAEFLPNCLNAQCLDTENRQYHHSHNCLEQASIF
jgi:hypothetical protein